MFLARGTGLAAGISSHFRAFLRLSAPGRSELLKIAQSAPRAAQSRSESLRARPEPLRVAQSGRSELFEEPLRVAQSAPRAGQSCSGSPRARPELLRAAQNRLERAQSRSEPL